MNDDWSARCPEGHGCLDIYSESYHCTSCGLTYDGQPFDAETEFPVEDAEPRSEWTVERAVTRLYEEAGNTHTAKLSRHLGEHASSIGNALAEAANKGLVEKANTSTPVKWQLSDEGYVRACGEDPDFDDAPAPERVDPSDYLIEEPAIEYDKQKLYRLHWGYGLSVLHIRELCGLEGKNTLRRKLEDFGIPIRSWHDHTGWEPHHGIPPMYEWPRGEDPNVEEDDPEWIDYKPAQDVSPEVPSDD